MTVLLSFVLLSYAFFSLLVKHFTLAGGYDVAISGPYDPTTATTQYYPFGYQYLETTFLVLLAATILFSIYFSLVLSKIGKKQNMKSNWITWIPFLNIAYLFKLANLSPWLILLTLVPILGILVITILVVVASIKLFKKMGSSEFLGLVSSLPGFDLIFLSILAFR